MHKENASRTKLNNIVRRKVRNGWVYFLKTLIFTLIHVSKALARLLLENFEHIMSTEKDKKNKYEANRRNISTR